MKNTIARIGLVYTAIAAVLLLQFPLPVAHAATLTAMKDTLTSVATSATPNHTILFTTSTGVSEGQTITITYPAGWTISTIVEDDVDIQDDGTDLTTAVNCAGTEKASAAVSGQVLTFTLCAGDGGAIAGASIVTVKIGTNATQSGTGTHTITSSSSTGSHIISIGGTMTDSGSLAVSLVADDSVNITANVDPAITFTISDTTIGFGTLTSSAAAWANGAASGSGTDVAAHTMAVGTNAASGYVVTYNGATLTIGGNTISVMAVADDADGTAGTEQFGMSIATNGDATITAGYAYTGTPDWKFVASTTTTIISETVPTATETFSMHYLANIASTTEPGSYQTDITYIATGTF